MGRMITLAEYAAKHGIAHANVRQKILRGNLTAQKVGRNYLIDEDEPYLDNRRKGLTTEQINRLGAAYAVLASVMRQHRGSAAANPLERPLALQKASMTPVLGLTEALYSLHANRAFAGHPERLEYVDRILMETYEDIGPEDVMTRISLQGASAWWQGYYGGIQKTDAED